MADLDVFSAMGIAGFGKSNQKRQLDPNRFDKNKRTDTVAPSPQPGPSTLDNDPDSDFEADDTQEDDVQQDVPDVPDEYDAAFEYPTESNIPQFPITHEMVLKDHTKVISALSLDPSGARILSGSHDYDCKIWDFGGMGSTCKPFTSWEPSGSYHINDAKYSNDGQKFLVIAATLQPKLYGRDGEEIFTFIKGDPYIRDMKHTLGHVSEITSCAWHPKDSQYFITASADSTIRIWDVENKRKQKTVIVVKSKERGARTKITDCAYSPDGKLISGACLDGALHVWQANTNFVRPNMTMQGAHTKGSEIGSVTFSVDGRTLLTRGADDTVKLWDLRSFKKPLAAREGISTLYPHTNAVFSPDEKFVLTGAGAGTKGERGSLHILERSTLEVTKSLEVDATPVKVVWHSKINQIVAGLSNGQISVFYSPMLSLNGAKLLLNKGAPRKVTIEDMSDALAAPTIMTPQSLSMYKDGDGIVAGSKRKRDKSRMDPRKSRRPELPVTGPGKGGRVGASATQHIVQHLVRDTTRDEDPREALLKYADSKPIWTSAWQDTQPTPVFQEVKEDEKSGEEGEAE